MPDEEQKKEKEKIIVPWFPGPIDDEWDSPAYNDFWSPIERAVDKRILDAKAAGKEVELVSPDENKSQNTSTRRSKCHEIFLKLKR